jgi:hypothetical protein
MPGSTDGPIWEVAAKVQHSDNAMIGKNRLDLANDLLFGMFNFS